MQAAAIVAGLQTPPPKKKNDIRFFFRKLAPEKIGTKIGTSSCVPPKETKKKEGNSKWGGLFWFTPDGLKKGGGGMPGPRRSTSSFGPRAA